MNRQVSIGFGRMVFAALLGLSGAGVCLGQSSQQDSQTTTSAEIEEVIVTAQRREQNLQDVPISISQLAGDELEKRGITSLLNLTSIAPSIRVDTPQGDVIPRVTIRGLGTNDFASQGTSSVTVYHDEVPYANLFLQGFPPFDLERIEVLRGPQGTLWGRNTTGGLLHFVSERPSFAPEGYASLLYGRYNEVQLEGAVSGPIEEDTLAGRASFLISRRDGYITNLFGGEDLGERRDAAARVQLLYQPSEVFQALLSGHARVFDGDASLYHGLGFLPGNSNAAGYVDPRDRNTVNMDITDPFLRQNQWGANLNMEWKLGSTTLTSITAYEEGELTDIFDDDGSPDPGVIFFQDIPEISQVSQEFQLSSDTDGRISWILGAFYQYDDVQSSLSLLFPTQSQLAPGGLLGGLGQNTKLTQENSSYAGFASTTLQANERLTVTGGVRYTEDRKDIDLVGVLYTPNPNNPYDPDFSTGATLPDVGADKDDSWGKVTWDVSGTLTISDDVNLYARVARGFRSGNFNGSASLGAEVSTVDPEIVTDYEIGLKGRFFDGRLVTNLGAFQYDYEDIQILFIEAGAGSVRFANAPGGKVTGGEVEVSLIPVDGLLLSANVGIAQSEYDEGLFVAIPGTATVVDAGGNQFINSPEYTGTVNAEYSFPLGGGGTATLFTGWRYTSEVFFNPVNDDFPEARGLKGDSYWMGDVRASYLTPNKRFEFAAFARNVTDEQVVTFAFGPFLGSYNSIYDSNPRTYGVSIRMNFD